MTAHLRSQLLLLGTGAALTDGSREPTMLALHRRRSTVLVDCGANVVRQLQRLSIPLDTVERLILTHVHPDHTSGLPLLIEMLWLSGRRVPLPIHGPAQALDVLRAAFEQWDTSGWKGMPELGWQPVPLQPGALIAAGADFELIAAPGRHGGVHVIGVRARDLHTGGVVAYSADGEPSDEIRDLALEADILVHEATGAFPGHSSAEGAAELARAARARKLVLVHLAPLANDLEAQRQAAAAIFGGDVILGRDLDTYEF